MSVSGNSGAKTAAASRLLTAGRVRLASSGAASRRQPERPIEFKPRKPVYVAARAVGSFVPGLTRKSFEKFGFATAELITDWPQVAGAMAAWTAPERIRWPRLPMGDLEDGTGGRGAATLMLRVDPARALDVEYQRAQLMERINAYFGYRAVADIRIVQGAIDQRPASAPAKPTPTNGAAPAAPTRPAAPTPDLDGIADDRLRGALARLQAGIAAKATTR